MASVGNNLNIRESGGLQKKSQAVFGKPEKIVRLFVQRPIHWPGQDHYAAAFQYPEGFAKKGAMVRHVFDYLRDQYRVITSVHERQIGGETHDVRPRVTRLNHVAANMFVDAIPKHRGEGFVSATDIQQPAACADGCLF